MPRKSKTRGYMFVSLRESCLVAGVYPEDIAGGILLSKPVAVLNCYLRFPEEIKGQ